MKKLIYIITGILISTIILAQNIHVPYVEIKTNLQHEFEKSFRIAMGDIITNISMHEGGLLGEKAPCLLAGIDYDKPWTRDASINVWNGFGLISPGVAKNTLLAQLRLKNNNTVIGGQYWDSVIWIIGAWQYYLFTGEKDFLQLAYDAGKNTIELMEAVEYDSHNKLFKGPAVYGDGVAAYPKIYTEALDSIKSGTFSGIESWPKQNQDKKNSKGFGIPMFSLSTNCIYYQAYFILSQMRRELGEEKAAWLTKANKIKNAINEEFWNEEKGMYNYLIDPFGGSEKQESLGNAFAILFDIANDERKESIFNNLYITDHGIPCVYPTFKRYSELNNYGRHSGTIWPHIQGFWAQVCSKNNKNDLFWTEYLSLTDKAFRDQQFVEIYHPVSGEQYGGIQEPTLKNNKVWDATNRQTWSATAYLSMVIYGILGLEFEPNGIVINPNLPIEFEEIHLSNLHYRDMIINFNIVGNGNKINLIKINGKEVIDNFIGSNLEGIINIEIVLVSK